MTSFANFKFVGTLFSKITDAQFLLAPRYVNSKNTEIF